MNVKNNIKKVSAVLASAALVATTMVGAMAYDLSDYPAPFVEDGMVQGAIVVGANAATADVIGAIDIAASLQAESVTPVAGGSSGSIVVEGAEEFDEIFVGDTSVTYDSRLDDSDLEGFVDSDLDFDGSDYDYEDFIVLPDGSIDFVGSQYDEDFGNDIYGVIENPNTIRYIVEIEGDLNTTLVTTNDEIEFEFLGRTVTVTDFDDANTMTIESSSEFFMQEGDSVTVDGHEVTLVRVGANSVLVSVDGQTLAVSNSEEFDQADDFEVEVESQFYIEGADDNSATLKLGASISETVDSGDSAEMFGEPSDEADADWLWYIDANDGDGSVTQIGLQLNIDRTGIDADEEDERDAMMLGDSIELPNNYASIRFADIKYDSFTDLTVEVDDDYDVSEDDNGDSLNDAWGYYFTTDADEDYFEVSGQDTEEVWVLYKSATDFEIWYTDGDDEVNSTATDFDFELDGQAFTIAPSANLTADGNMTITFPTVSGYVSETLALTAELNNDYFGSTDEEDAQDLYYGGSSIGTADYDGGYFMTNYGAYFESPEDQFNGGNTFTMSIPMEIQEVTLVVQSEGSVVTAGSSSGGSYVVNPIALGLGILDTDAPALGTQPMIIVGGPAANTVAAEFMGNPTRDEILATFSEGKALIRYDDDNQAMLVAGWGALETQGAANVVSSYEMYDFEGTELEVVVTDLSNVVVTSIN